MNTITETLSNGNTIEYKEINGIFYHAQTNQSVIDALESSRNKRQRIIVDYGDTETGKSWNEQFDITGYIGNSTGRIKIPLLIHNSRSMGGGALLDDCIIKISTSTGKRVLYQHPKYHS